MEADHVVPVSLGGSESIENMALLCEACHKLKTNIDRTSLDIERAARRDLYTERFRQYALGLSKFYGSTRLSAWQRKRRRLRAQWKRRAKKS